MMRRPLLNPTNQPLSRRAAALRSSVGSATRRLARHGRQWAGPLLLGALILAGTSLFTARGARGVGATDAPFQGTTNDPQVRVAFDLRDSQAHPRQLVYDAPRDGLWFWTSIQHEGESVQNQLYFYDIAQRRLQSWPLTVEDWSAQVLAGLAVAPDGQVWIGWHRHVLAFHPSDGTTTRYELPEQLRYPLPEAAVHGLPTNLGIADLAVAPDGTVWLAPDGTVWLARDGALSLTALTPATGAITEYPLPAGAGDPAKLAIGPDGHLFFTINRSADHPGHGFERVGEFDPRSGATEIYPQPAQSLVVTPQGDLLTGMAGRGANLARLPASERASARAQRRAPVFAGALVPFVPDGAAFAMDPQGRLWVAVAGQPRVAVYDLASGQTRQFQYAAPSLAALPPRPPREGEALTPPAPDAVWLSHMVAMVADRQGHLWYIRAGSNRIEEVAA